MMMHYCCCSTQLVDRSHRTVDFFTDHHEDLLPVGLAFFQSEWDESVQYVFHHVFSNHVSVYLASLLSDLLADHTYCRIGC